MANIKDVAFLSGVSVTTVSRVMNNRGYISDETRKRVYDAIRKLNYQPNELARNLYQKKSKLVGLVVPDICHDFFSTLVKYVSEDLYLRGYKLMVCDSGEINSREKNYIDMLMRNQVDGIIIASHTLGLDEYTKISAPIVAFDVDLGPNIPIMTFDHEAGGRMAAEALLKAGCHKVLQLCGSEKIRSPYHQRNRIFASIMAENGVECIDFVREKDPFNFDRYVECAEVLLQRHKDVDGFFATDLGACAFIKQALKLGYRIPEDIKVIGYDGTNLARMLTPSITTIKSPVDMLVRKTIDTLIDMIDGKEDIPERVMVPVYFQEGETV